ncbi:MAG TPA: hypothetical protein VFP84_32930 [Kofleriaceae bacterium]|nr:hypothetical protein [Kofleriaceae bacterium]
MTEPASTDTTIASPGARIEYQSDVLVMALNNPGSGHPITGAVREAVGGAPASRSGA